MKKAAAVIISVIVFCAISVSALGGLAQPPENTLPPAASKDDSAATVNLEDNNALRVRLGQLINLNRVYDDCILSDASLIDEASVVLLKNAETTENGDVIIRQAGVLSFIQDLYGRAVDISSLPDAYTKDIPDGYFYVVPRGYDAISQTITDLKIAENGIITVCSDMILTSHEGDEVKAVAETDFILNGESAFGYNIVNARIVSVDDGRDDRIEPDAFMFDSIGQF